MGEGRAVGLRLKPLPPVGRGWGGVFGTAGIGLASGFQAQQAHRQKNPPNIFPTLSTHAILARPSVPTDGRSPRSAGRREAVSSGARGPYPGARSLRSRNPGQRGGLPDRGGSGQGFSREWPEPVAGSAARPFGRKRQGLKPAAFDPRSWSGRAVPPALRCHRKRRPKKSLPRLTNAGGQRRVRSPKGRTQRNRPGLSVRLRSKESQPAPGRRGRSLAGGRGRLRQANSAMPPRASGPRPTSPDFSGRETEPDRRRDCSRAGFWRGCRQSSSYRGMF